MFVTYNGITLETVKTNDFSVETSKSEDGTTYLYDHYVLDCECVFNPDATAAVAGVSLPAETFAALEHYLTMDRQTLLVEAPNNVGGLTTLLQSPDPALVFAKGAIPCDANNGPKVSRLRLKEMMGFQTWIISFRVETWLRQCHGDPTSPGGMPALLANRWQQGDDIAFPSHLTTRTTTGVATFATDVLSALRSMPDRFRSLLIPPCPLGFQRQHCTFLEVKEVNQLHYTVNDQQVMFDLGNQDARLPGPFPNPGGAGLPKRQSGIVKIEGMRSVSSIATTDGIASPSTMLQIDIKAWGNEYSNTFNMLSACIAYAMNAANPTGMGYPPNTWLNSGTVRQSLTDRYVEIQLAFRQTPIVVGPFGPMLGALRIDALRYANIFAARGGVNTPLPGDSNTRGSNRFTFSSPALKAACAALAMPQIAQSAGAKGTTTAQAYPKAGV